LFEPASSAWHRNDEPGFRKSTSSCKFFRRLRRRARMAASRSGIAMARWPRLALSRPPIAS